MENTSAQLSSPPANTEAAAGALLSADLISSIHMCAPHGWKGLLVQKGNFRPFLLPCHGLYAQQIAVFTYKDGFSRDRVKRINE